MIIERFTDSTWKANAYLVADGEGGNAVIVDSNGEPEPVLDAVARLDVSVTHILNTHEHEDHVADNRRFQALFEVPVVASAATAAHVPEVNRLVKPGDRLQSGALELEVIDLRGHSAGQVGYVADRECFTGDSIYAGSVAAQREPGGLAFDELRERIVECLKRLPGSAGLHPGHGPATTVEREWDTNPFIRLWRGVDEPANEFCRIGGPVGFEAWLELWTRDYDGGFKAQVRFPRNGRCVVPGSLVTRGVS